MWMDLWSCGCRERYPHEWGLEGSGRTVSAEFVLGFFVSTHRQRQSDSLTPGATPPDFQDIYMTARRNQAANEPASPSLSLLRSPVSLLGGAHTTPELQNVKRWSASQA